MDPADIKRIIREHSKQLYTHNHQLRWDGTIPWKPQTTKTHPKWNR